MEPADTFCRLVENYAGYLQPSGELHDPVFHQPTQYGTAYYALCNALAATVAPGPARAAFLDRARRGLGAALEHVLHPEAPATASEFRRDTGIDLKINHRDFFWPPILKTFRLLRELGVEGPGDSLRISRVDIARSFAKAPPNNWAAVWLSGEWIRIREGLSPHSRADLDRWLEPFFLERILLEQGLYLEPGHPNSYDLFTRYHLADLLAEGYDGSWYPDLAQLLKTGLRRSLAVQLSDGSLASAFRSTGQTWTLGCEAAYFTLAARLLQESDPELATAARQAAWLAFTSIRRWQRPDGMLSPVENCLPAAYRVGYERYTADAHYANLALAFLGLAIHNGLAAPGETGVDSKAPPAWIEGDPTFRAILHNGNLSLHVNARPSPEYDAFGIVDLTFGPDRLFHFASSVKHLETGRRFNLGMAHDDEPGGLGLTVLAQQDLALAQPIKPGAALPSLELSARPRGQPYLYALSATLLPDQAEIRETTPGLHNFKSLLIPYLRDAGTGKLTRVEAQDRQVQLWHGDECIEFTLDRPIASALDVPYGFENRRGLCGLLRLDFAERSVGLTYRVTRRR